MVDSKSNGNSYTPSHIPDSDPESQPIRTAKRQRVDKEVITSTLAKKNWRRGTAETARFQSPPEEYSLEIKDSYEEDLSSGKGKSIDREPVQFRVELPPICEAFDREAYAKLSIKSSQPSQLSQPSQSSEYSGSVTSRIASQSETLTEQIQLSQYLLLEPSSQPKPLKRPLFLWNEDSPRIIPDSQENQGSSAYIPSALNLTTWVSSGIEYSQRDGSRSRESALDEVLARESNQAKYVPQVVPFYLTYRRLPKDSPGLEVVCMQIHTIVLLLMIVRSAVNASGLRKSHESRSLSRSNQVSRENCPFVNPQASGSCEELTASRSAKLVQTSESQEPVSPEVQVTNRALSSYPETAGLQTPLSCPRNAYLESSDLPPFNVIQTLKTQSEDTQLEPTQRSISTSDASWQAAQVFASDPRSPINSSSLQSLVTTSVKGITALPARRYTSQDLASRSSRGSPPHSLLDITDPPSQNTINTPHQQAPKVGDAPGEAVLYRHNPEHLIRSIESSEETSFIPDRPSPLLSSPRSGAPHTFQKNSSPRDTTPQNSMADQPSSGTLTIAEMLKQARAAATAKTIARQEVDLRASLSLPSTPATAVTNPGVETTEISPAPLAHLAALATGQEDPQRRATSSIPSTPAPYLPSEMAPLREPPTEVAAIHNEAVVVQNQKVNIPPILEHPPGSPSYIPGTDYEANATGLQLLPLEPMEHVVALPMVSTVRSIYETELSNNMKFIKLLNREHVDVDVLSNVQNMIDTLKNLCDHQSLIEADFATQENTPDFVTTRFAENISTKCQFLAGLLRELRSHDTHIVVIVQHGRMENILGAILREYGIGCQNPAWPLRVTLFPINFDGYAASDAVHLVIDFDSSFKHSDLARLKPLNSANSLTPLVHLVINHSIEHLELCLDDSYTALERTRAIVNGTLQMLEEMGKLDSERYLEGELAGKAVASYFNPESSNRSWPLLSMPGIKGLDLMSDISSQSELHATQSSGSTTQSYNTSTFDAAAAADPAASTQSGIKRPLQGDDDSTGFAKRQRQTPDSGEQSSITETSGISNTGLTRSNGELHPRVPNAREDEQMAETRVADEQAISISSLLEKVRLFESSFASL